MIRLLYTKQLLHSIGLTTFLLCISSNLQATSFLKLKKEVEKNNTNSTEKLQQLKKNEQLSFVLNGNYADFLHILYLDYEINKKTTKKYDKVYQIKMSHFLKNCAKNQDHYLYYAITSEYCQFIYDYNTQLKIMTELTHYSLKNKMYDKHKENYLELAICNFNLKNYYAAIYFWEKSIQLFNPTEHEWKSSILNNIACAYEEKKDLKKALKYNQFAINEINKIKHKTLNETYFYYLLLGNKGDYLYKNGDYNNAYKYFQLNYNFYLTNREYEHLIASTAYELIELNKKYNTPLTINIKDVENIYSRIIDIETKSFYLEVFSNYFELQKNYRKSYYYYKKHTELLNKVHKDEIFALQIVNKQLNKDKVKETVLKSEVINEVEKKKTHQIYLVIVFVFINLGIFIFFKIKNVQRQSKWLLQENELDKLRQKTIENELKFQKESNLHLQLNLDIKQKSEQVFMEKLKEIRRKKHIDPEEIIKELQLQIINLLQIDKKNKNKTKEKSSEDNSFTVSLIALNKKLSEQELRLCTYFKMNLSTKEISQLEQHLAPASIRVLKNRIKKKLELGPDENLNQFLNSLN